MTHVSARGQTVARRTGRVRLPAPGPGSANHLVIHRYRGRVPGPKAYVQAAVHADEVPALLVADHLRDRLDALAAAGRVRGEIVLVPFANPVGLTQFVGGSHLGRFDLDSGRNFNRGFPDLADAVAARVEQSLRADAAHNVRSIRAALLQALGKTPPQQPERALSWHLFRLAVDADIVLDLHCDFEALEHLYVAPAHWPAAADLAAALGTRVVLLAEDSGGDAFDEACARIWWKLARRFPEVPVPPACFAATVELRGERDVDDRLAARDADGVIRFLAARGAIAGPGPRRAAAPLVTALESVDIVTAPAGGVLTWRKGLGARVRAGDVVGEIVVPGNGKRVAIRARTTGLLFARRGHRWVRPGQMVAKVAGRKPLPSRHAGALVFD